MRLQGQTPSTFVLFLAFIHLPLSTGLFCIYRGPSQFCTGILFKSWTEEKIKIGEERIGLGPGDHTFVKQSHAKLCISLPAKDQSHICLLREESQISIKKKKATKRTIVHHNKVLHSSKMYTTYFQKDNTNLRILLQYSLLIIMHFKLVPRITSGDSFSAHEES